MGAALELLVIPALLVTLIGIVLVASSLSVKSVFAIAVAIALVYFVLISLLRFTRQLDRESEDEQTSHHG